MREIFTRLEDGSIVYIEVDMNAYAYIKKFSWLFSVFVKFDALDETNAGFEEFLETKESLIIALEHNDTAKYVGMRVVDGWSELYFYSDDSKELDSIVAKMLKPSSYIYESSVVKDSKWDFHYKNIFPTELELCHIESEKIIFLLQEENENLEIARDVEHYVSFDVPTQKNRFINTLTLEGFSVKDEIDSEEFANGVALVKNHAVTSEEVRKVVEELFAVLKKSQGYYEGWSTTLVNPETL
jgi:regulator of RNase E activity RraB